MPTTTNQAEEQLLKYLLKEAVDTCYREDFLLVKICGMERACVARIFYHMQTLIIKNKGRRFQKFKKLNLDCEYNKKGNDPKRLSENGYGKQPDIILHSRQIKEDNKLVV